MIFDDGSSHDTHHLGFLNLFDPFPFDFFFRVARRDLGFEGGGKGFSAETVQFDEVFGGCTRPLGQEEGGSGCEKGD